MALNLGPGWEDGKHIWQQASAADLKRARREQGWDLHAIADMQDLVAFARAFSRRQYGGKRGGKRGDPGGEGR